MLNIIILINPTRYSYHTNVCHMIQSTLQADNHAVSILDINTYKHDYECLNIIKELQPDVLITLDLSGFRFRTQAGETALNMLLTKNLNLVWGNKAEYASFFNKKISLSMLFYDATGTDHRLMTLYPNLPYYKALGPISCSTVSKSNAVINKEHFQEIWTDFLKNILF